MAANTNPQLQTQIIYSIYVRNHTPEGTFRAVIPDLDRIRALGTDIIWFLPIHPIGVEGKKGTLGCPYANRDYRSVNPTRPRIRRSIMSTPTFSIAARTENPATKWATGRT